MGIVLATLSALFYGAADYCGGRASRGRSAAVITLVSQAAGIVVLGVGLLVVPGSPTGQALAYGALGGISGGIGIVLLYYALSIGTMSVVSPTTAVIGATIPLVFGVAVLGERPAAPAVLGSVAALASVALVTSAGHRERSADGIKAISAAAAAGVALGFFFVCLQQADEEPGIGLWAIASARPASIAFLALYVLRTNALQETSVQSLRNDGIVPLVVVCGMLDQLANVLFAMSLGRGTLAVLAVLASLYPVSTVLLARIVDHERLQFAQQIGVGFAFVGLVLIAGS